ncbi:MAG: DUF3836 domain-containing protein [Bacteroidaceae bacterium]|nr:DUF3836 domain-containing protein [Bacteroidaceae bacterium]
MKAINFFAAVITSMILTVNANASTVNQTEPSTKEVEQVKSNVRSTVVNSTDGKTYKYDYILDANGRVVNRVKYTWNTDKTSWKPVAAYSVVYTDSETVLSYAKYNEYSGTFSTNAQQTRYKASDYPVVISLPECCK